MLNTIRKMLPASLMLSALIACGGHHAAAGTIREEVPLTLANAESAGFVRTGPVDFARAGAIDGSRGTWGNDQVQLYVYANDPTPGQLQELRGMTVPDSGRNGLFIVRNVVIVSDVQAMACRSLRALVRSSPPPRPRCRIVPM
jgi:hypothetical protein